MAKPAGKILKPDICVIGAGSGGLVVASAAASFGVDVVLIEKDKMGGDCLNTGCIPSKALIAASKQAHSIRQAPKFGVDAGDPKVNFKQVHDRVHEVIKTIEPMDSVERYEALGVTVLKGEAHFTDKKTVCVGDTTIKARRIVVATGSNPFVPPIPGLDNVDYLTNEDIFDQTRNPGHLVIVGGGPIGMEMAQAHQRLGAKVTVIEAQKALGKDDPELAAIVLESVRQDGVNVLEDTKVTSVEKLFGKSKSGKILINIEHSEGAGSVEADNLLIATGRIATIAGLDLDKAGIKHSRRGIEVDRSMRTSNRKVYAIGDVAGGLQFTHAAAYQAGLVIRATLFRMKVKQDEHIIPWCTFTDPELAHVGHNEETARAAFKNITILRWPYSENDRAQAEGKTAGLIKIITDKKGRIQGASIAGALAGEMINFWALAISKNLTVKDVAGYVSPYPTMTEIGKRAATSFYVPATKKPYVRSLLGFLRNFG